VITEKGYGKCMQFSLFPIKGRGGKGMAYLKVTNRNGTSVGIRTVDQKDEIILSTSKGMVLRVLVKEISTIGRATAGVRIVNVEKDDQISDLAIISNE